MEITEVSIGQNQKPKGKISLKVQEAAQDYLAERSISLEHLTDEQYKFVVKYIKEKRAARWAIPIMVFLAALTGLTCFFFIRQSIETQALFLPTKSVVTQNGTRSVADMDKEMSEEMKSYGFLCAMFAAISTAVVYGSVSTLTAAITLFFKLRRNRKILDAFLPAVRLNVVTDSPR